LGPHRNNFTFLHPIFTTARAQISRQSSTTMTDMNLSAALRVSGRPRRIATDTPAGATAASLADRSLSIVSLRRPAREPRQPLRDHEILCVAWVTPLVSPSRRSQICSKSERRNCEVILA